jgi:hypothetical protein
MIERAKARVKLIYPLLIPLILYIGALAFSMNWLELNPDSPWRYVVALSPMIPGVWIAVGVVRAIKKLDELERSVLLEGVAVSFVGTLILVMSLGFLEIAGLPPLSGIYIGLFMVVLWLITKLVIHKVYE